ncbi:MAG TPA: hypothetical protein VFR37_10000 [Longimicrobium sp.]|nr:hypothetical protein [Longimicrobium sp.]
MRKTRGLLLFAALLAAAACRPHAPAVAPGPAASIRDTDFRNFQYVHQRVTMRLADGAQPEVRRNGIVREEGYYLDSIAYADVTGDGREEAVVTIEELTGGSAIPHWVFVYGDGERNPQLLWSFETGDRAYGGLKDVYADGGKLVVELYGRDRLPSEPESLHRDDGTSRGMCCPSLFTRSRYAWNGRAFVLDGAEVLPYEPEGRE